MLIDSYGNEDGLRSAEFRQLREEDGRELKPPHIEDCARVLVALPPEQPATLL